MNELPPDRGKFVVGKRRAKFSGVAPRRTSRSTSPRAIGRSIPRRGTLMRSWSSGIGPRVGAAGVPAVIVLAPAAGGATDAPAAGAGGRAPGVLAAMKIAD